MNQTKMNIKPLVIGVLCNLAISLPAAQGQEMATDRPDQSNTPALVPTGALQIETGVLIEAYDDGGRNYTYNNTLLKFGVNENFEVRLATGYVGVKQTLEETSLKTGLAPLAVGIKIKLADQKGFWPQAALISHVTLRTGADYFNPQSTCTDMTLALAHSFSKKLSVTYNGGIKWNGDSPEATWLYALSAAYSLSDALSLFVESYGFFPEAHAVDHRFDAGLTYKVRPRIQLDLSGGMGLGASALSYFMNTGLSARLFK